MKVQMMKVGDLIPYENNPRKNEPAVDAVAASIKEFGFRNPIIIDTENVIVAGHTRLMAAEQLGLEEVPVTRIEDLSEEQIKAFRLADNKTAELAGWDFEALDLELFDISDIDMSQFGFEANELVETEESEKQLLSDRFIIPPFDIFNARGGEWTARKRHWKKLIDDEGQARKSAKAYSVQHMRGDNYTGFNTIKDTSILDPVLSEIVCKWFAPEGGACFDCFAGDTVFGYVSSYLGHSFTGIEIREEQCDFNNEHCDGLSARYICDDGRNVLKHIKEESQDLLFSCPPYYNIEVYSDLSGDASNQETYEDFYAILDEAFTNSIKCLKDNRFAVIVVGDVRDKRGAYYNFPNDIIGTFTRNGLILYNNIKLLTPIGTAAVRANNCMKNRKTVHVYQDVLVFYKGDPNKIQDNYKEIEVADVSEDMEL